MKFKTHLVAFFTMILLLNGCSDSNQVTRNIRVIAQAEVDGKLVEGSAVMGIRWQAGRNGRMYIKKNTEAVALELGDRGTVYVLDAFILNHGRNNTSYWPSYVASSLGINRTVNTNDFPTIRNAAGRYPVSASISRTTTLPLMVAFEDEMRRETMFEVTAHNFGKKFGKHVRFVGLWFEFTNDSVTSFIEQRIPLMFQYKNNESYTRKYPIKDKNGNLIPFDEKEIPQKVGKTSFKQKAF